jgi:hypothetical protein
MAMFHAPQRGRSMMVLQSGMHRILRDTRQQKKPRQKKKVFAGA